MPAATTVTTRRKAAPKRRSTAARNRLVEDHLALVRHIVRRMARRLPPHVDSEELISAGYEGLIRAAERFDEERGVAFSTFAGCSVRGAVLDALRDMDPLARPTRERITKLEKARSRLAETYGGAVPEHSLAAEAGLTDREARDALTVRHAASCVSIDEERAEGSLAGVIEDPRSASVAGRLLIEEAVGVVRQEMSKLRRNDRRVVAMYYADGLLLREIADVLGVTEGRISQIHKRALTTLRNAVQRRGLA